ncbi:NERD domain-containing protein [Novosphingobium sp. 9]|uniref:NERD domain-containing protein n=1 Tax=Novosphingobium sp. 9 TaxID=2025349 RepID=UPI0021B6544F|nr:NERD domain-containing protein [Novosphingobium sp. 9]
MSPLSASLQIFHGDRVTNPAEIACARQLKRDLEADGVEAVLLANVTLGPRRRQIDLIVATATTAVVVEIKAYLHPVYGGVNGPWSVEQDNGSRRELGSTNPYQQALENRFTVTDSLRGQDGRDAKDAVAGMLCLYPGAPAGSNIPAGDFKLAIGGYAELVALLKVPRTNALSLDQWRAFALAQGLADQSMQPPSAADQIVAQYLTAHADLGRTTLGPYVEPQFDGKDSTAELARRIAEGEQLQIVGPSGSGKTELLKHLATACAARGNIPLLIRGRDFGRGIGPLLRADAARYSREKIPALFRAAVEAGAEIVLHVDAVNECPADKRAELVAALQAARINYGARIVITGQEEIGLPTSLAGATITLNQPEPTQAHRIVEAHLGRALTPPEIAALEVVATAHDAAILAAVLDRASVIDGRYSLYYAFSRARLDSAPAAQDHRRLSELATAMRIGFVAAMPKSAAERIVGTDGSTIDAACAAGLLWSDAGGIGFRHDLIADFYAADAILHRAGTPAGLHALACQPIHAELREFILGGCATTQEIETLLANAPDSRLLESALSGRAGAKARSFVLSRMSDLIAQLKRRYSTIDLALPDGVTSARELSSLVPGFTDGVEDDPIDDLYLNLIPAALGDGLLADLLDAFAAVDRRLLAEAERLRERHPDVRLAWRAAACGTVYGMHHFSGARHLQTLLQAIQNSWSTRGEHATALDIASHLDAFESFSVGQLFLLVSALRCARGEPMPARFPELLRRVWRTQVYHLRLIICDFIRFRGGELGEDDRLAVRDELNSYLTDDNLFLNSSVFDALVGVDGIEHDFTIESAVEEYEAMLAMPDSPEACSLAVSAVTRTYDHPFCEIYWEAFYDVLPVEKRQALLLRGLRDRQGDPWFISDILRALHRDPTPEAATELQQLARGPRLDGHSHQCAVVAYAEAISLLAKLDLPLEASESVPDDPAMRAWHEAAPLLHALGGGATNVSTDTFFACGVAEAFDVIQRVKREARIFDFDSRLDVAFERLWPDMVRDLARAVLARDYVGKSAFAAFQFGRSLEDEHIDAALQFLAQVGRPTDLALVQGWLEHPRHGEQALATARALERSETGQPAAR